MLILCYNVARKNLWDAWVLLVFSALGGCETHAESIIHQLAQAISDAEGTPKAQIKGEIMEKIAISLGWELCYGPWINWYLTKESFLLP